jgi:pimeloyl-ACP methyl ester carboxylesterase
MRSLLLALSLSLASCSYMEMLATQSDYARQLRTSPEQRIYKHMLDHETFFVLGKIGAGKRINRDATAVVALSDRFRSSEVVDVNYSARPDSYYSLNLPAGDYRLLVVSDLDGNGYYDETEIVGSRTLALADGAVPNRVLCPYDINLDGYAVPATGKFRIDVRTANADMQSLFYPDGSIRPLDDPLFSPEMAALGLYEPAAFLETAPSMFYALEEDHFYKIPVIFIHGIEGSARGFSDIVAALDRTRFKPLFFHYPSGADLNQMSAIFYSIFLSGKFFRSETPMVIIAHSMGGLVAREALNLRTETADENRVQTFITIGSPMGGMAAARRSEHARIAVPAWRDIIPESAFIEGLHRKPLPEDMQYHLLFTYGDTRRIKWGDNGDGVVPLASALDARAQQEASAQLGFNDTHMGILKNREAIAEIVRIVGEIRSPYPEPYLRELAKGGYRVELGSHYTPLEKFYIRNMGFFMNALASGELAPLQPSQKHFVAALRGETSPRGEMETGWMKFAREYPDQRAPFQYAAGETNTGQGR